MANINNFIVPNKKPTHLFIDAPVFFYCGNSLFCLLTTVFWLLKDYFPSLNFLYPSYLSLANCSVLVNSSFASSGKVFSSEL